MHRILLQRKGESNLNRVWALHYLPLKEVKAKPSFIRDAELKLWHLIIKQVNSRVVFIELNSRSKASRPLLEPPTDMKSTLAGHIGIIGSFCQTTH